MGTGTDDRSRRTEVLSWFGIAVIISLALMVVAFMVWWGYALVVSGLMVPILLPFVAADLLTKPPPKLRN